MKISRPDFNKPKRCPTWAGPGWGRKRIKRSGNCEALININYEDKLWRYKLQKCDSCGVIVLPFNLRYLDWYTWYLKAIYFRIHDLSLVRRFFMNTAPKFGYYSNKYFHTVKDTDND